MQSAHATCTRKVHMSAMPHTCTLLSLVMILRSSRFTSPKSLSTWPGKQTGGHEGHARLIGWLVHREAYPSVLMHKNMHMHMHVCKCAHATACKIRMHAHARTCKHACTHTHMHTGAHTRMRPMHEATEGQTTLLASAKDKKHGSSTLQAALCVCSGPNRGTHQLGVSRQVLQLREGRLAVAPLGSSQALPELLRAGIAG